MASPIQQEAEVSAKSAAASTVCVTETNQDAEMEENNVTDIDHSAFIHTDSKSPYNIAPSKRESPSKCTALPREAKRPKHSCEVSDDWTCVPLAASEVFNESAAAASSFVSQELYDSIVNDYLERKYRECVLRNLDQLPGLPAIESSTSLHGEGIPTARPGQATKTSETESHANDHIAKSIADEDDVTETRQIETSLSLGDSCDPIDLARASSSELCSVINDCLPLDLSRATSFELTSSILDSSASSGLSIEEAIEVVASDKYSVRHEEKDKQVHLTLETVTPPRCDYVTSGTSSNCLINDRRPSIVQDDDVVDHIMPPAEFLYGIPPHPHENIIPLPGLDAQTSLDLFRTFYRKELPNRNDQEIGSNEDPILKLEGGNSAFEETSELFRCWEETRDHVAFGYNPSFFPSTEHGSPFVLGQFRAPKRVSFASADEVSRAEVYVPIVSPQKPSSHGENKTSELECEVPEFPFQLSIPEEPTNGKPMESTGRKEIASSAKKPATQTQKKPATVKNKGRKRGKKGGSPAKKPSNPSTFDSHFLTFPPQPPQRAPFEKSFSEGHHRNWIEMYQKLKVFKELNGTTVVPFNNSAFKVLANWVKRQRYQYRLLKEGDPKAAINSTRIRLLNEIGFVWEKKSNTWEEMFALFRKIAAELGDTSLIVVSGRGRAGTTFAARDFLKVARWIENQQKEYLAYVMGLDSSMTVDKVQRLEQAGLKWKNENQTSQVNESF